MKDILQEILLILVTTIFMFFITVPWIIGMTQIVDWCFLHIKIV